jgi:hypothetical protein
MRVSAEKWFLAGEMMGAMGMGLGMNMDKMNMKSMKRARRNAANMAIKMSREAGNMISDMGESFADRLR